MSNPFLYFPSKMFLAMSSGGNLPMAKASLVMLIDWQDWFTLLLFEPYPLGSLAYYFSVAPYIC